MRAVQMLTIALFFCAPAASHAQWTLQVLGPLDGRPAVAAAMNDKGAVVGYSWNESGSQIPFVWTAKSGYRTFLDEAGGLATDINNRGDIVGVSLPEYTGFVWSEATGRVDLGAGFWPLSINQAGVVAGACSSSEGTGPCIWANGSRILLIADCGGVASAINKRGDVAGYTLPCDTGAEMPFVWRTNGGVEMLPVPDGTYYSVAESLNNAGVVVGWRLPFPTDGVVRHQVSMWDKKGTPLDARTALNGILLDLSNSGIVIGVSPALRYEEGRGFALTRAGEIVFLAGGDASLPADVNARGDIAGSIYMDGVWYAAIWRHHRSR